ncbi:hypothetical protein EVAR_83550_1 [Eumeta japonica]|uniref:Uncharacterized protein n=1 Tax=Eumeta variegata TaxID=151549 RepID=A0A4C2A6V0_EUMVA|nr:hypothetical protein EVAR_83550_1 [Eumeta japonica]
MGRSIDRSIRDYDDEPTDFEKRPFQGQILSFENEFRIPASSSTPVDIIHLNTMDQHSPCPPGAGGSGPKKQITFEFIQQVLTKALSEIGYEAPQELVNKLIARVTPVSSRASSRASSRGISD